MKLDRFRAPALAATAVLLISGAGIAFAAGPSAVAPAPLAPVVAAEPAGPDTDTLQEGDQTTPDVTGAGSASAAKAVSASTTKAAEKAASETAAEGTEGSEAAGAESDGPGGHEDPAGQNADHQFEGEE
jgi:hypothetical protein